MWSERALRGPDFARCRSVGSIGMSLRRESRKATAECESRAASRRPIDATQMGRPARHEAGFGSCCIDLQRIQ